jgi:uncharacterized protein YodC (DUF2158 family)
MMPHTFEVGQVVKVKSGGPEMTIQQIDDYGSGRPQASCVWFDGKKRESYVFELDTLEFIR